MKRWLIPAAIVVPLLVALGWLLYFSPWLSVAQVQVSITSAADIAGPLPADEVRSTAAIEQGAPLLRVDTGAIEERLAALPAVQSVTSLPS